MPRVGEMHCKAGNVQYMHAYCRKLLHAMWFLPISDKNENANNLPMLSFSMLWRLEGYDRFIPVLFTLSISGDACVDEFLTHSRASMMENPCVQTQGHIPYREFENPFLGDTVKCVLRNNEHHTIKL